MTIRLTSDEAWEAVGAAHTGILTTLRRDGMPIALPVWFVVDDRSIALMTPAGTKKIARIRHDPRASFLVESGERYTELRGVHLTGRVELVEDHAAISGIEAAVNAKYAGFRPPTASLPAAAQAYYASQVFLRFLPDSRILTWDNARLALK
ncbi:MAG TPA: pyridoxamine 5'-phosphate oxidase family protein [Mycobacterium sp.]|uniref:pyridoxamine 5'-phosphate oxidase family protein n=1 Tax=Mycobacterium sp. TaxID=1785 RepID=UPI002B79326C|nr:pyridoxamine 5'-phosphate oxidase family protein [Mycobacterium sp.]HME78934.1 pyridoxamine 5'-phosphate oxidase family protein [Mycobacterium sp.]